MTPDVKLDEAALEAAGVRALEWAPVDYDPDWHYADGAGYRYSLFLHRSGKWRTTCKSGFDVTGLGDFVTADEAKVAAQADYAQRILSALSPTPAAQQSPAPAQEGVHDALRRIREAARRCRDVADGNTPSTPDTARMAQYRLEEAASLIATFRSDTPKAEAVAWAVTSKSGMHVGLWTDEHTAWQAAGDYSGSTVRPLYEAPPKAEPGIAEEGWIEWAGGLHSDGYPPGVEAWMPVEFRVRSGEEYSLVASAAFWHHTGDADDIVAYRRVSSQSTEGETK